jgi:hypothetical protein
MSIFGFLILAIIGCAYMAPWLIACRRRHNRRDQIGVLNLVGGWNPVFWACAFTWATDGDVEPRPVYREPREPMLMPEVSRSWLIAIGVAALIVFVLFG